MNEKDTMKLLIRHEYEESVEREWKKRTFADYLLDEFADIRIKLDKHN